MFGTKISNYTFGQAMGAKHKYMVARVNKELCLTKPIHFVKVLCREFVLGNLFSLGQLAISSLFANVKVSGGQELAQSEENLCSSNPEHTYPRKSTCRNSKPMGATRSRPASRSLNRFYDATPFTQVVVDAFFFFFFFHV